MKQFNWKALITSLVISLGTGAISAFIASDGMRQYENMYNPPLAPPGWLFPIVWTILYILMGIAAYLVYEAKIPEEEKKVALLLYGIQLFVNGLWSLIFFNLEAYLFVFAWLVLLWYLIYRTLQTFYKINPVAGILFIPYLLWVTFAGYLNLAIAIHYFS